VFSIVLSSCGKKDKSNDFVRATPVESQESFESSDPSETRETRDSVKSWTLFEPLEARVSAACDRFDSCRYVRGSTFWRYYYTYDMFHIYDVPVTPHRVLCTLALLYGSYKAVGFVKSQVSSFLEKREEKRREAVSPPPAPAPLPPLSGFRRALPPPDPVVEPLPALDAVLPNGFVLLSECVLRTLDSYPVTTLDRFLGIVDRSFVVFCNPELSYLCFPISNVAGGILMPCPRDIAVASFDVLFSLDSYPVTTPGLFSGTGIVDRPFIVSCSPVLGYLCCPMTAVKE
jgi:hypothetical protein